MARAATQPKPKRADEVEADVRRLLAAPTDDSALRDQLEILSRERTIDGLTWLWGPILYKRNRTMFRPFILSHFSDRLRTGEWQTKHVSWRKDVARSLDPWLEQVDRDDDVELFKKLYRWKLADESGWRSNEAPWRAELVRRFADAHTPSQRTTVLAKYSGWWTLDEPTALTLYRTDAHAARGFILKHLPRSFWGDEKRKLWRTLFEESVGHDPDFAFSLYRKQVPLKEWTADALRLCNDVRDARRLDEELERRHPEGWGMDLGKTIYDLAERRKRDVLPYVFRHLKNVFARWYGGSYENLLKLAVREQWLDLWAAIVRTCANQGDFQKEINRLLDDASLADDERQRRLVMLTGASREWNFPGFGLAQVHHLEEYTAFRLYDRYPHLVRGPFKLHVLPSWWAPSEKLLRRLIDDRDEPMIDLMASRWVTHTIWEESPHRKGHVTIETLADYYTDLTLDDVAFSRRAAAVLTQVPAYSIYSYNRLIRSNRLARLLFERSATSYLADDASVRDLVEGSEIHVQALAYRVLSLDDERARRLARENLDILLGSLLRPLHRRTRLLAFGALKNGASAPDAARNVLDRARLALDLPDSKYPKEYLVGLIGHIVWRHPELRSLAEQPVVHEHPGRAA